MNRLSSQPPRFSIILATYNRAYCLAKAVDSVLKQDYPHYELLIVDDGSTDGTQDLLEERYAKELASQQIRYIPLACNQGVCAARNEALRQAANPWICYIDSDNFIKEHYLSTFVQAMKANPKKRTFYADFIAEHSQVILSENFDFQRLLIGNYIDLGVFVHHRSAYSKLGGYDLNLRRLVDWDLIIRYTRKYKPIHIKEVVMVYDDSESESRISVSENLEKAHAYVEQKYTYLRSTTRWRRRMWGIIQHDFLDKWRK